MIKDRLQKKMAAKFCAAQGIVPFVEVVVSAQTGLEEAMVAVTDVDVIGLDLNASGVIRRLMFDCKSTTKQSGINRALWAGGLKSLVRADHAFVIQKKDAPDTHRLVANAFQVHIHSETSFSRYSSSASPLFLRDATYLDDLDVWDQFGSLSKTNDALREAVWLVTTQTALEQSGPKGVRTALATLIKARGELDPAKPTHHLLFRSYVSAFMIFLSFCANELKEVLQFTLPKELFEQRLRYFVWEGRENYETRRQMKIAIEKARGEGPVAEFDLPDWKRFVELMRAFLDAPTSVPSLAYLAKEIAFRKAGKAWRADPDEHLRARFDSNKRARQFIFSVATYLVSAARLPKEFVATLEADVNDLVDDADRS